MLAAGIGAVVLAVAYTWSYLALSDAESAGGCSGIGFGCRPSPALTVGLAAAMTAPAWLALVAAAAWATRRRGSLLAVLLTWASVVVAIGTALWLGLSVFH